MYNSHGLFNVIMIFNREYCFQSNILNKILFIASVFLSANISFIFTLYSKLIDSDF